MSALNTFRKENEQGFTLIELLVVILIIGVLAAIAIPMFINQRKSAIDATTVSDTHSLATAIETEAIKTPFKDMKATDFSVVPLSAGTQWTMTSNADGYCLKTYNTGGDSYVSTDTSATYDSTAGGLNKSGGECSTDVVAASATTGSAIGTPGAISFISSDDGSTTITADGTYTYDAAAQTVTYSFDFKNLDSTKTYNVLISAAQSQGSSGGQTNHAFTSYSLSGGNTHVGATVSLQGVNGPVLSAPDKVVIYRGFAFSSGNGSADIYDPSALSVK